MLSRRKRPRSGIKDTTNKREWPRHREYVRGFSCVCFKIGCTEKALAAHLSSEDPPAHERAGTGIKAHDKWTFPACPAHHDEQHRLGFEAFEKKYGLNLYKACLQMQIASPCKDAWAEQDAARAAEGL